MRTGLFVAFAACCLIASLGCKRKEGDQTGPKNAAASSTTTAAVGAMNANDPVAQVGDIKIPYSKLNDEVKSQVYEMEEDIYRIKKQKVDQMVEEALLEKEAKGQNKSVADLLKENVESKGKIPSDQEMKDFYDKNKDRIGRPFEETKDRIRSYLQSMGVNEVREGYINSLKAKTEVKVFLPQPARPVFDVKLTDSDPTIGPKDAKITIVEFTDFQCPFCKRTEETVKKVVADYKDKVKFVFKHFPLDFHPKGRRASSAAECARDQGKFWEYHEQIFAEMQSMEDTDLISKAEKAKLNMDDFKKCFSEDKFKANVERDMEEGRRLGVRGTPAFFVNGKKISGAQPYEVFKDLIEEELKSGVN